jgi:hypothetical protein
MYRGYLGLVRKSMRLPWRGKDYWQMSDDDLEALAIQYKFQAYWANGGHTRLDRRAIIDQLIARDTGLNAYVSRLSMIVAVISAIVSMASAIFTLIQKISYP